MDNLANEIHIFAFCSCCPQHHRLNSRQTTAWFSNKRHPLQAHKAAAGDWTGSSDTSLETIHCDFLDPGHRGFVSGVDVFFVQPELDTNVTSGFVSRVEGERLALVFQCRCDCKRALPKLHSWGEMEKQTNKQTNWNSEILFLAPKKSILL